MKPHSQVGLITNSSSSTYTSATHESIGALSDFANKLLQLVGSNMKAEDLLDIKIRISDDSIENLVYRLNDIDVPGGLGIIKMLTPEELAVIQQWTTTTWNDPAKKDLKPKVFNVVRRVVDTHGDEALKALGWVEYGEVKEVIYETVITDKDGNEIVETITNSVHAWEEHD